MICIWCHCYNSRFYKIENGLSFWCWSEKDTKMGVCQSCIRIQSLQMSAHCLSYCQCSFMLCWLDISVKCWQKCNKTDEEAIYISAATSHTSVRPISDIGDWILAVLQYRWMWYIGLCVSDDTDTPAVVIMISSNRTRQASETHRQKWALHFYSCSTVQTKGVKCVTAARQCRNQTAPRHPARCMVGQPSNW